jgi:hypothetical protein
MEHVKTKKSESLAIADDGYAADGDLADGADQKAGRVRLPKGMRVVKARIPAFLPSLFQSELQLASPHCPHGESRFHARVPNRPLHCRPCGTAAPYSSCGNTPPITSKRLR